MKHAKFLLYTLAALTMALSLSNTQAASAVASREEGLAASTPPLLSNIQAIGLGENHTCALTTGGGVKCWGHNYIGQLGNGSVLDHPVPKDVSGLTNGVTAITTGDAHTCALTSVGGVKCWGANGTGQLGDGTEKRRFTPVDVSGLSSGILAISAGAAHTCALTSLGGVKCWGDNYYGQLGDGTTSRRKTPTDVWGLSSGVIAISAGRLHSCALTSAGGIKCWGWNGKGQLGTGTTTDATIPYDVIGLTSEITSISAGGYHTCALTSVGGALCWGWNNNGQLGDSTTTTRLAPTDAFGLTSGITAISTGDYHTCARTSGGGALCWGKNNNGQLGDGTVTNRATFVNVSGLTSGVNGIDTGVAHTCALSSTGRVKCWGNNQFGQLGDGRITRLRKIPVDVVALDQLITRSIGAQDGYIWESTENSNVGLHVNSSGSLLIGDDNSDRQYRAILSFNTSPLPNTAIIYSATIRLYYDGKVGNPDFQTLVVDINKPFFGAVDQLEPEDFQAAPSMDSAGIFSINGYHNVASLKSTAFRFINLIGLTQFRIRYLQDDNDNMSADYYKFYSGDTSTNPINPKPELTIVFYVP